ncbi:MULTISPECIES: hypothetical protein [Gordonia]|uniref:hypothetical protein n=1 Tax=Gordonia TaxID=2053 RepID=UPI000AA201EA|nr:MULTISPECIES: hypothetical protein [Gordonia]
MAIDYSARAIRYWAQSEHAHAAGDPQLTQELADIAAHCDAWAHEDLTGVQAP